MKPETDQTEPAEEPSETSCLMIEPTGGVHLQPNLETKIPDINIQVPEIEKALKNDAFFLLSARPKCIFLTLFANLAPPAVFSLFEAWFSI